MLKSFFYLCLATLSLGQLVSLSKISGLNIYLFDVVITFFALFGTIHFLSNSWQDFFIPKPLLFLYIFCFVGVMSLIKPFFNLPFDQFIISGFYLFRLFIYTTSGVVVANMVRHNLISPLQIVSAFIYSGLFIALAGFIQLILIPDFEILDSSLGWDPHKNRLASTFFDPNFTGGYLVLCLTLLIYKFDFKKFFKADAVIAIILGIALVLTFSRSAWGMMSLVILVYGLFKYRLLLFGAILLAFLAYFAVPRIQTKIASTTDPADSAAFRLVSWKNTWNIAKDNLFLGVGFNTFRYVQKDYGVFEIDSLGGNSGAGSDSSLLFILATTGVLGLVIFLAFLMKTPLAKARGLFSQKISNANAGGLFGWAILIGLLFQSQFINSLFFPQVLFFITIFDMLLLYEN